MTTSLPISLHLPEGARANTAAKELELGQVVFGKVMRVYEDGSALVDIHGRQHVVDSAIPLKQEEVFRGKIVGLGEHVVLEKMVSMEQASAPSAPAVLEIDVSDRTLADNLKAFVAQHRKALDIAQWNQLLRVAGREKQPLTTLSAAVYLQKLGIPFAPDFAVKLSRYLAEDMSLKPLPTKEAIHLSSNPEDAVRAAVYGGESIRALADYLKEKSDASLDDARDILRHGHSPDPATPHTPIDGDSGRDSQSGHAYDQALFQWLMNSQIEGATSHRMVVLPLVFDGRLVELEMSLLDQNDKSDKTPDLRNKVIHFSLNTEHLGKVSATINAVNSNLRIHFSAESDAGLQMLSRYHKHLYEQLENLNQRVDELSCHSRRPAAGSGTAKPILDFVVTTGSLSILA